MNFHNDNTYVNHINLKVKDLSKSIAFYQDILGFSILSKDDKTVFLTADNKTSFLSLTEIENYEAKNQRTTGLYHLAILLPNISDLANFTMHLVKKNLRIGASDHLVSLALYFDDIDGNGIEVYIDKNSSDWTWDNKHVNMASLPLDFDKLLKHETKTWDKIPEKTILGHIHLHVNDLEAAKKFYCDTLDFDLVSLYGDQAMFISTNKYHHHIGLNTWNGTNAIRESANNPGLNFFNLKFKDEEELINHVSKLKENGYDVFKEDDHYTTFDPVFNKIHLSL